MPASSTTRNFRLALSALAALLAIGAVAGVAASGDTPTTEPTPTASPTPYPQSTITVRFVRDGEPAILGLSRRFGVITADGVVCNVPVTAVPVTASEITLNWPLSGPSFPHECTKGPPTLVTVEFTPAESFVVEIQWNGGDIAVDVEIPAGVDPIAKPSSPATPTPGELPARLPSTGGERGGDRLNSGAFGLILLIVGATTIIAAIRFTKGRR